MIPTIPIHSLLSTSKDYQITIFPTDRDSVPNSSAGEVVTHSSHRFSEKGGEVIEKVAKLRLYHSLLLGPQSTKIMLAIYYIERGIAMILFVFVQHLYCELEGSRYRHCHYCML